MAEEYRVVLSQHGPISAKNLADAHRLVKIYRQSRPYIERWDGKTWVHYE